MAERHENLQRDGHSRVRNAFEHFNCANNPSRCEVHEPIDPHEDLVRDVLFHSQPFKLIPYHKERVGEFAVKHKHVSIGSASAYVKQSEETDYCEQMVGVHSTISRAIHHHTQCVIEHISQCISYCY